MQIVLDWFFNILAFAFVFLAIGFCIFSHELGHFLAAKWRGLHIDAFSLGFKPFWRKKINGVEYRLGYLPFGGYVELPQVDATDEVPHAADGTELPRAKPIDRVITAVAGPTFNILSGLLIGCFVWWIGVPQVTPKMRELNVVEVDPAGPEYKAGLRAGDKIVKINGESFHSTWQEVIMQKMLLVVGPVELEVVRDGKPHNFSFVPQQNPNAPPHMKAEKIAWPFFEVLIPLELRPKKNSPATRAGIKAGDIVLAANGRTLSDFEGFQDAVDGAGEGKPLELTLLRGDRKLNVQVVPEPFRDEEGKEITRYLTGIRMMEPEKGEVLIDSTMEGGSAAAAGLRKGDRLLEINGEKVSSGKMFQDTVQKAGETPLKLVYVRDGQSATVELAAKLYRPKQIGVEFVSIDHPTPVQQFWYTLDMSYRSLVGIGVWAGNKLGLTEQQTSIRPSHMSGPLGIGTVLFTSVRGNIMHGIYFMVIVSFALAIFNLLPLPVLDGGHIVFGFIEIIFKRPLPTIVIKSLSAVFVALLIGLMVFVTFSDVKRLARLAGIWTPEEKVDAGKTQE